MIRIIGNSQHEDENRAALRLRDAFLRWKPALATNKDEVIILIGVQAFGARGNQDIDLLLIARLSPPIEVEWCNPDRNKVETVALWSFCATFEVKGHEVRRHDGRQQIRFHDNQVDVLYGSEWYPASLQALGQGKAFGSRLRKELGNFFPVVSFVWLFRVSDQQMKNQLNDPNNVLPSSFELSTLAKKILDLDNPRPHKNTGQLQYSIWVRELDFESVAKRLTLSFEPTSLDRSKIENILKRRIDFAQFENLGKKQQLVVGRAGSGKTMVLLRVAVDFFNIGKRTLILTYNKSLVADIRRLLMIMKVTGPSYEPNINICTLHLYFTAVICAIFPEEEVTDGHWFDEVYPMRLAELVALFKAGAADQSDVKLALTKINFPVFDIACVDEGQDWLDVERDLLHYTVGKENCIVASGFDQLVRNDQLCDWTSGGEGETGITRLRKCLRMKSALAAFANSVATVLGLSEWEVDPDDEVSGGQIIIKFGSYADDSQLHNELVESSRLAGNENIDMLFCVGPHDLWPKGQGERGARLASVISRFGGQTWDATLDENRNDPPRSVSQFRIVQYDSCRGLEGWVVVAEHLDQFYNYKMDTYRPSPVAEMSFFRNSNAEATRFAGLWSMIPLTRAIDTIVITIADPQSVLGQAIVTAAAKLPDIVRIVSS